MGLAVTTSMQEANAEVVEGSAYRMPVSLKVSRKYIELNLFLKKIGQLLAVCSVTGTNCCGSAAMTMDLTSMHISAHAASARCSK